MKIIHEGEKMPTLYGVVIQRYDMLNAIEVAPIPWCWIKRYWYKTLNKTKRFNWEKRLVSAQNKLLLMKENDKNWVRATSFKNGRSYCIRCGEELSWCNCKGYWEYEELSWCNRKGYWEYR